MREDNPYLDQCFTMCRILPAMAALIESWGVFDHRKDGFRLSCAWLE